MRYSEYDAHRDLAAGCMNGYQPRSRSKAKQGSPVMAFMVVLAVFSPLILWIAKKVAEVL